MEQFTNGHQLITSQTISAQEMLEGEGTLELTWAQDAAYALVSEQYADGTVQRTLLERGDEPVSHTCWAAEESGMTVPFSVSLQ